MRVIIPKLFRAKKGEEDEILQFVEHGNLLSFPSMTRLLVRLLLLGLYGRIVRKNRDTASRQIRNGLLLSRGKQGSGMDNIERGWSDLKHRRGCGDGCRNNSSVFLGSLNTKLGGASVGERCQWRGNRSPWRITISVERVHSIRPSSPKFILIAFYRDFFFDIA